MTLDEFLKHHVRCPHCEDYDKQLDCRNCRYRYGTGNDDSRDDHFKPRQSWTDMLNREVTE